MAPSTERAVTSSREKSCAWAVAAGIVGSAVCALTLEPGDGVVRVTAVVRVALVLLAFSVVALWLVTRPPRRFVAWAFAATLNGGALAVALGVGRSFAVGDLSPFAAVGMPGTAAGATQVVALAFAAFLAFKHDRATAT